VFDPVSASGCMLCDEVRHENPLSVRLGHARAPGDLIILETANFLLLPDISPIVPGHSLLITKEHISCFAQLPRRLLSECLDLKASATKRISDAYGAPMCFEHGSSGSKPRSGVCVQHAHIHFIPVEAPVESWLDELGDVDRNDLFPPRGTEDEVPLDYLWYQNRSGATHFLSSSPEPIPCQFLRGALARHFGLPNRNWKSVLSNISGRPGNAAVADTRSPQRSR
jgi:diadenosine tetraphosphate (Ap4A) HIT family hydrolase